MDATNFASLLVAAIAAFAALAAQRSASKSSKANTIVMSHTEADKSRTELETEAYTRARALDTETIDRLDEENKHLRIENKSFANEIHELHKRVRWLEHKIAIFEGEREGVQE